MYISNKVSLYPKKLSNSSHVHLLHPGYTFYILMWCFGMFICFKCLQLTSTLCINVCKISNENNRTIICDDISEVNEDGEEEGEEEYEEECEGEEIYEPPEHLQSEVINAIFSTKTNSNSNSNSNSTDIVINNSIAPLDSIEINQSDDIENLPSYSEVYGHK